MNKIEEKKKNKICAIFALPALHRFLFAPFRWNCIVLLPPSITSLLLTTLLYPSIPQVLSFRGEAGIVGRFLGHPGWVPLARLSYGAYLIHPIILNFLVLGKANKVKEITETTIVEEV